MGASRSLGLLRIRSHCVRRNTPKPQIGGSGKSQDSTGLAGLIAGKGILDDAQDVLLLVTRQLMMEPERTS